MQRVLDFIKEHWSDITYIIIIIFLTVIIGVLFYKKESPKQEHEVALVKTKSSDIKEEQEIIKIKVDVKGEVNSPGVYELDNNSIVIDAIIAAGGVNDKGTTENINLSYKLSDGMVIIVYDKSILLDENKDARATVATDDYVITKEVKKQKSVIETKPHKEETSKTESKKNEEEIENSEPVIVNINTATKEELLKLNGIGDSKAESIIAYREENGVFETIEELKKVSGIGDSIFENIKDFITIE